MTSQFNPDTVSSSLAVSAAAGLRGSFPIRAPYPETRPPSLPALSPATLSGFPVAGDDGSSGSVCSAPAPSTPWTVGRTAEMLRHLSHHEASHALVARALGRPVAGVTIVPTSTNEGLCWFSDGVEPPASLEQDNAQMLDFVGECVSLVLTKPRIGEKRKRVEATHAYRVQQQCVELLAGKVAELVMWPNEEPFGAHHDQIVASALALTVVASEVVEAYLAFCAKEAEAIIRANVDVLQAIADALLERGTLTGKQLDKVIRAALARRDLTEDQERRVAVRKAAERAAVSASLFERFL